MKEFEVKTQESGNRLDKYLVTKLGRVSRHSIKELIDGGRVKINGKRVVIAKWAVDSGDRISVRTDGWTPTAAAPVDEHKNVNNERRPEKKAEKRESAIFDTPRDFIKVVYEDRDVLVVDKPAGAVIQAGARSGGSSTYVDSLRAYLKRKHKGKGAFVSPVHRLDKETSGLMVFALSKVGEKLVEQFKKHTVYRGYFAIVDGAVPSENGRIGLPLKKGDFGHGRRVNIGRDGDGANALTLFHVKERYKNATFIRLELKTGRTHQARVHMAAIGYPIVGDRIYGKKEGGLDFSRQALHSETLIFKHPAGGRQMKFKLELPPDMAALVDKLRE